MKSKNQAKLQEFMKYCEENPEQRFWQALTNWGPYNFIFGGQDPHPSKANDLFYID